MKNLLLIILVALGFGFNSCKKEESSSGMVMTATIDSKAWSSSNTTMIVEKNSGLHFTIAATSGDSRIKLDIGNYKGVGKYIISDSGNTAVYYGAASGTGKTEHVATSGQIEITEAISNGTNRNRFKGTFQFLAGSVQVTSGNFDVSLYLN